jgi:hypothetical protein
VEVNSDGFLLFFLSVIRILLPFCLPFDQIAGGCGTIGKLPTSTFDGMCGVKWCRATVTVLVTCSAVATLLQHRGITLP